MLYQDTSSISKRYLSDETGTTETQTVSDVAEVIASSLIAFAEVKGVLARARKARRIRSHRAFHRISQEFDLDWGDFFVISVSEQLVRDAGRLATEHALTGIDALHLAPALALRDRAPDEVLFSTWDGVLAGAARTEGLSLAHEVTT